MPRPRGSVQTPSYCRHKSSGRAYVTIDGKPVYLGPHGSQASKDEYARVVSEWLASGRHHAASATTMTMEPAPGLSVSTLLASFWEHAKNEYPAQVIPGRRPSGELGMYFDVLRPLRRLYGATPANEFGPRKLKALREEMIRLGWSRNHINRQLSRARRVFKWGVESELVPASVWHGLQAVRGLRRGRSGARETPKVRPAPEHLIEGALPHLSRQARALLQLQLLTGARAGELVIMRTCDIDRSGTVWIYRPARHKTEHHDIDREIRLGPRAQEVLTPFLKLDLSAYVFSPAEAEAERHESQRRERKTNVQPSQVRRASLARRRRRRRPPRDRYDVASYRRALERACERAFPPPAHLAQSEDETVKEWRARLGKEEREELRAWRRSHRFRPHQLRHNAGQRRARSPCQMISR